MILKMHYNDLIELQQSLLAAYFFLMLIGEDDAAEGYGEQFDRLYRFDSDAENGVQNIHNALNFDWDES